MSAAPAGVVPFWPAWTHTLDAITRRLARARSRCRHCHVLLHVDPDALRGRLGGSASLIDRIDPCTVVGCTGTVYYLGASGTGVAYHVLIADPALREGVIDPMDLPFRSRWHALTTIGPRPLPLPAGARIITLPVRKD